MFFLLRVSKNSHKSGCILIHNDYFTFDGKVFARYRFQLLFEVVKLHFFAYEAIDVDGVCYKQIYGAGEIAVSVEHAEDFEVFLRYFFDGQRSVFFAIAGDAHFGIERSDGVGLFDVEIAVAEENYLFAHSSARYGTHAVDEVVSVKCVKYSRFGSGFEQCAVLRDEYGYCLVVTEQLAQYNTGLCICKYRYVFASVKRKSVRNVESQRDVGNLKRFFIGQHVGQFVQSA